MIQTKRQESGSVAVKHLPETSLEWIEYFRRNELHLLSVPWQSEYRLTPEERRTISSSISVFQLGESSEGNHFMEVARKYAGRRGDPFLAEALECFLREEQRHARDLGRFMLQQEIAFANHHWTDHVFRFLRKLWNLEICIAVLLVAELVAKVYYKALRNTTRSPVLHQICSQLLRDETRHVHFHTGLLRGMRRNRSRWRNHCQDAVYRCFFAVTLLVVWPGHSTVLRSAGYPFRSYWRWSWHHLELAFRSIQRDSMPVARPAAVRVLPNTGFAGRTHMEMIRRNTQECLQFIDLTDEIAKIVQSSGIQTGFVNIQTKHTTTAILVNENEPLLLQDMRRVLEQFAPQTDEYLHNDFTIRTVNMGPHEDRNGHSHCKAMLLRTSETIHLWNGKLQLGTWQRIFLLELDRARERTVSVMVLGGPGGSR